MWAKHENKHVEKLEKIAENVGKAAAIARSITKTAQDFQETPEEIDQSIQKPHGDTTQDAIDKAFADIKVSDIVKRLQGLARLFKNREIARQLSIIDLMLDKLGIAGLFPQLAEATRSALESNQYSSVRIEEILSKLMSVVDESGKVRVSISERGDEESLVDREMRQALEQSEALSAQEQERTSGMEEPGMPQQETMQPQQPVPQPAQPAQPPMRPMTGRIPQPAAPVQQ